MSVFTPCRIQCAKAPVALPLLSIVRVTIVAAILTGMGLAHIYLRFEVTRLQRETNRMQALRGELTSEIASLRGEAEALKQSDALYEYAKLELGLVEYSPTERELLRMPDDIHTRYALARAAGDSLMAAGRNDAGDSQDWLATVGEQAGVLTRAIAGEAQAAGEVDSLE